MEVFEDISKKVMTLLESGLPSFLTYHSAEHTSYVLRQAEIIGTIENIDGKDMLLVRLAALFHDTGFLRQYNEHEAAGCDIAREILGGYDIFDKQDIESVCGMIMATRIPHQIKNNLDRIVADADLEYLGTTLFKQVSELLFQELKYIDPDLDETGFRNIQISFLKNHRYHTRYCIDNREPQKQKHLEELLTAC